MAIFRPTFNPYLQILWNGEAASVPCLYLFTDMKKYVFNCSEGTQRLFTQRKISLGKLDTFFMTRYQWSHMGGLPGFGMTLRDMKNEGLFKEKTNETKQSSSKKKKGKPNFKEFQKSLFENNVIPKLDVLDEKPANDKGMDITIYAPSGMNKIIEGTKHFLRFDKSDVNFVITDKDTYKDEEMTVNKITIHSSKENSSDLSKTSYKKGMFQEINYPTIYPPVVCYACKLTNLPGRFDVKTAVDMGVPKGPMFATLQRGQTVPLENGTIVTPSDVVGPETPGPSFLLVDCPHESYIEDLTTKSDLQKYQSQCEIEGADIVIHLSSPEVCQNDDYKEWVNKFPSFTRHIFTNDIVNDRIVYNSQHNLQILLHNINKDWFPALLEPTHNEGTNLMHNFEKIYLRKHNKLVTYAPDFAEIRINRKKCMLENVIDQNRKLLEEFQTNGKRQNDGDDNNDNPSKRMSLENETTGEELNHNSFDYPKVICLGTGASIPSKYRNVSATLVFNNENEAALLDCGEGTYGQLLRHYGDNTKDILLKIKFIFISHMHADHHLGLIMLLNEINKLKSDKDESLAVMGPSLLLKWLTDYAVVSESLKLKFVSCENSCNGIEIHENLRAQAVKVDHPGSAYGVVINSHGIKTTYSGDSMPCDSLIKAGHKSTLLIHEATLEDDMVEDALWRKHSTTKQALQVGQRMQAENTLLTHFSQRYPKLPIIKEDSLMKRVVYAFDHMEVAPRDFPTFSDIIPILNKVFDSKFDEDV